MRRSLKINPDFRPCPTQEGDELYPNGIFVFNISRMLEYLQSNASGIAPSEIDVDDIPPLFSDLDESTIATADLNRPLVLAEIAPGQYNLIDGHHRAERARREGVKKLKTYRLTADQHIPFLTSDRAYHTYVEYWNGKLRDLRQSEKLERRMRRSIEASTRPNGHRP